MINSKHTLNVLALLFSGILTLFNLWEWFVVSVLKRANDYPFGESYHLPYYYKNAELYATVHLFWAGLFTFAFLLSLITVLVKMRILIIISMVLTFLLFLGMLYHSTIGVK